MRTSASFDEPNKEEEPLTGELVELSEQTCSFLEAAFSITLINADCKKRIAYIRIPDCDKISCRKLDPMLTMILLRDAIKADGYLSHLQQFWLDAIVPLAAILESTEAKELTPEQVYSAAQSALVLLGNPNNHMSQEKHKRIRY